MSQQRESIGWPRIINHSVEGQEVLAPELRVKSISHRNADEKVSATELWAEKYQTPSYGPERTRLRVAGRIVSATVQWRRSTQLWVTKYQPQSIGPKSVSHRAAEPTSTSSAQSEKTITPARSRSVFHDITDLME